MIPPPWVTGAMQAEERESFFIAASLAVGFITRELPGQRKGPPFDAFFAFRKEALDGKVAWNATGKGKLPREHPYSLDNYVQWCRSQQDAMWAIEERARRKEEKPHGSKATDKR